MANHVAILHGWSDRGRSFRPLRDFLSSAGFPPTEVWLGDYISLDDDVRVEDVALRMEAVIKAMQANGQLSAQFDLIVHSTGALVAREWMATFYPDGKGCPVKRFVMLAPANYGSKLAAVGKSMLGRLAKGLGNRLETGEEMLRSLELGSPYQWKLTQRDLLDSTGDGRPGPYGSDRVWPFVIVGTRAYDSGLKQVINEAGSDGTVRVSAANLNAMGLTIDFTPASGVPEWTAWGSRMDIEAPLAVLPERDHSEITHPEDHGDASDNTGEVLAELVLEALRCPDAAAYGAIQAKWDFITEATADLAVHPERIDDVFGGRDKPKPEQFHRYMQLNVMVRDNHGQLVDDYFLEFRDPDVKADTSTTLFHTHVLEDVHKNTISEAYRCLYVDHTDLMAVFYKTYDTLAVSIAAAPPGRNVKYFDSKSDAAKGEVRVHADNFQIRQELGGARLRNNRTHFIEVIIPRRPTDKVFGLSPNSN